MPKKAPPGPPGGARHLVAGAQRSVLVMLGAAIIALSIGPAIDRLFRAGEDAGPAIGADHAPVAEAVDALLFADRLGIFGCGLNVALLHRSYSFRVRGHEKASVGGEWW